MKTLVDMYPMTTNDVASYLGVTTTTVYKLRDSGKLPYVKVGGTYRYSVQEIMDYVKKESGRNIENE